MKKLIKSLLLIPIILTPLTLVSCGSKEKNAKKELKQKIIKLLDEIAKLSLNPQQKEDYELLKIEIEKKLSDEKNEISELIMLKNQLEEQLKLLKQAK